jgi:hypothetical protein
MDFSKAESNLAGFENEHIEEEQLWIGLSFFVAQLL